MQIGPWNVARAKAAEPVKRPVAGKELGASGVVNLSGFLEELEYARELQGLGRFEQFERMRSSDGAVAEALGHIFAPIKNATWDIDPAGDEPQDLEVAEATRRAYFEWPTQPFSEYLDQALDTYVFGHQLFEPLWHIVDDELQFEVPDQEEPPVVGSRQFLTFKRFAQRLPHTIWKWNVQQGELVSVTQQTWKDGTFDEVEIPAEDLLLFVNRRRGDDFRGRSILRPAWKHWKLKELIEKIEAVALERHGVGVWVAYPSSARANDDATLTRMEEILQNLRAGAHSYIVSPGPKGQSAAAGQDGFLFEVVSPGGQMPDFTAAINRHRGDIKGAVLVRFSELGHGQTGARATGDVQSEVWKDALHAVACHFCESNDPVIRRFVNANYLGVTKYPKLVARDIESSDLVAFADAHFKLVNSGAIEPDRSYRAFVRKAMDAPPEDDPQAVDEKLNRQPPDPFANPDA